MKLLAASMLLLAGLQTQEPIGPDTVLRLRHGPELASLHTPGSGLVTLRAFVPRSESARVAPGIPHLQELLARDRVRRSADAIGARLTTSRTALGLHYGLTGARADFEDLAWILRRMVLSPPDSGASFQRARTRAVRVADRTLEIPSELVRTRLLHRLGGEGWATVATPDQLTRLDAGDVLEAWRRTHRPERLRILVAGDIEPELVWAAFSPPTRPLPFEALDSAEAAVADAPTGQPQILRSWYGTAIPAGPTTDPRPRVLAEVLTQNLRDDPPVGFEASVELAESTSASVILIVGASDRRNRTAMVRRLSGLLQAGAATEDEGVRRALDNVRALILYDVRTAEGLISALDHFWSSGEGGGGLQAYMAALRRLTPDGVRNFAAELAGTPPLVEELQR